jgi:hypothetical protein
LNFEVEIFLNFITYYKYNCLLTLVEYSDSVIAYSLTSS